MASFWKDDAACKGMTDIFFTTSLKNDAYDEARPICRRCPVYNDCLQDTIDNELPSQMYGFKAGMGPRTRSRYVSDYRRLPRLEGHINSVATHQQSTPHKATA